MLGRSPSHSSGISPLYSPNSRYPQAHRCRSHNLRWHVYKQFFLSHNLPWWEFFVWMLTELSPPLKCPAGPSVLISSSIVVAYLIANSFSGLDRVLRQTTAFFKSLQLQARDRNDHIEEFQRKNLAMKLIV